MKFSTYEDWKHCITVLCGIPLTPDYVEKRLVALNDRADYHTQKFVETWGENHLKKVIAWFEQARQELKRSPEGASLA